MAKTFVILFIFSLGAAHAAQGAGSAASAVGGGSTASSASDAATPTLLTARGTTARLGAFLAKGDLTLSALKAAGLTDGRLLSRDPSASVYAGASDPVFQIVLWSEKRVLFELDPKKQSLVSLEAFNADWSGAFPSAESKPGALETLAAGPREHLKDYCGKLPPGARCEVLVWSGKRGRAVRVDIHLKQGPPVPKAIEFSK